MTQESTRTNTKKGFSTPTISESLKILSPYLPPELIPFTSIINICSLASCLPSALTSIYGFERRLNTSENQPDFVIQISSPSERNILAGKHSAIKLPLLLLKNRHWKRIRKLGENWVSSSSLLNKIVDSIWMEFDVALSRSRPPIPGIFLSISKGLAITESSRSKVRTTLLCHKIILKALKVLNDEYVLSDSTRTALDCVKCIPSEGWISHIGVMNSRPDRGIKLCINNLNETQIIEVLNAIGWSGPIRKLQKTLAQLMQVANYLVLQIDIQKKVNSRIGIECYLDTKVYNPLKVSSWQPFCDFLVANNLCTRDEYTALLSFNGYFYRQFTNHLWISVVSRFIRHFKLIFDTLGSIEAKVYFGFVQNPVNYLK